MPFGYAGNILRIDLTRSKSIKESLKSSFIEEYLGGKGFGTQILHDEVGPNVDPLSPANKLIFVVGPATGTSIPTAGRYGVLFKSPLTGIYGESYSGGYFAPQLKYAGYDAVVIEGRSEKPSYLWISDQGVEIRDATQLWGLTTYETEDTIKEELADKNIKVVCIGPAGENLVKFANIENDYWRSAGRCGAGAVMGSKNLKAIAARGKQKFDVADPDGLKNLVSNLMKSIKEDKATSELYPTYGTPVIVNMTNVQGVFPTGYWEDGIFDGYEKINAEALRERILIESRGCWGCPIKCGKLSEVKEGDEVIRIEGPEYETIYSIGGLCKIADIEEIAKINNFCDKMGIDTITAGNVASFAIEAYKRGKLKSDVPLDFGNPETVFYILDKIVKRDDFGNILAEGVRGAAEKLGLSEIAVHVKGLEPAGYEPRGLKGMALGYMTSPRGACHLRSTAYIFDLRGVTNRFTTEKKAEIVKEYEDRFAIYDSLILCRFLRDIIGWEILSKICRLTTGLALNENELKTMAERIIALTRAYNIREGLSRKDDYLPDRFTKELKKGPAEGQKVSKDEQDQMLDEYYSLRGWNKNGIPTKRKLEEVNLAQLSEELP